MNKKPVAIILPCHNSGKHLTPAIESIINNTEYPWKLILIESESTDRTNFVCDTFATKYDNIKVYHTKKEGITKALNFGIEKARDLDVYLTQDDVIIPNLYGRDWLEVMVQNSKAKNCGVVTTIGGGGISGDSYIKDMSWVGTWSLFIPRTTLNKIGNFDENFNPGPGDDIDYSFRVSKMGLRIYIASFWVDHHRQTENFNDKIEFIKMKNGGYFRKKHNITPSWGKFTFDGEDFLIDSRTKTQYGCFKQNGIIDDPETMSTIKEITKEFKDTDVTLDIGANTGMMSLVVQKGIVMAFEPTPDTFDILKTNVGINKWKKIIPVNEAIYDREMPYVIGLAKLDNLAWSGMNKIEESSKGIKKTMVLDKCLDTSLTIKLIKIDTEGCDLNVLKGASKILDRDSPILITEDVKEEDEYLKKKGYKPIKRIGAINLLWKKI